MNSSSFPPPLFISCIRHVVAIGQPALATVAFNPVEVRDERQRVGTRGDEARAADVVVVARDDTLVDIIARIGNDISIRVAADAYRGLYECATAAPRLVVTEMMLPGAHGTEFLRRLRTQGIAAPAIIVTHSHPNMADLHTLDVITVLHKPVFPYDLHLAIRDALALRGPTRLQAQSEPTLTGKPTAPSTLRRLRGPTTPIGPGRHAPDRHVA